MKLNAEETTRKREEKIERLKEISRASSEERSRRFSPEIQKSNNFSKNTTKFTTRKESWTDEVKRKKKESEDKQKAIISSIDAQLEQVVKFNKDEIAQQIADMDDQIQKLIDITNQHPEPVFPQFAGGSAPIKTFTCSVSGTQCTIRAGTLQIHNVGVYAIPSNEVTLSSGLCWVYLEHLRDHSTSTFKAMGTYPASTPTALNIALAKYNDYKLVEVCHDGDINLDTPLL